MARRTNVTAGQVLKLVRRQDFKCAISGRTLTPETASLDHIVPLGRGGEHTLANIWIVNHQVNLAKGTLSVEEFVSMCCDVVRCQESRRDGPASRGEVQHVRERGMVPLENTGV